MNDRKPFLATFGNSAPATYWFAAALALALLSILFPTPQPTSLSNQLWRAELLTSLVLAGFIGSAYWHNRSTIVHIVLPDHRHLRWIALFLLAFTAWGSLSSIWAQSAYSAWHHSLVWFEYILFFLFAIHHLRSARDFHLISGLFLGVAGIVGLLCVIDYATLPNFQALEGILRMRYAKYAELLIALLPVGWMAAIYSRKRSNYILGTIVAATGWLAVMLSLSKGALLAGCIGFATTIVGSIAFSIRRFRPRLLASSGMLLILTIGVQVAFPMVFSIPSTADYISGKTGATRESSLSRVFVWLVGLKMVEEHLLTGVGADNFGERFNESRASYRMAHPNEPGVEFVSDGLVKRAHNEPLQVIAELGIIGIGLLGAAFFVFLAWVFRTLARTRLRASPMFWAAFGGMAAFGASSLVSSFSLRLVQNGIVFFLVFAVAVNEIMKAEGKAAIENTPFKLAKMATPVFAAISVLLVLMLATYGLKAAAEYMVFKADSETDSAAAAALYKSALRLDPDYASAYLRNSGRSYDRHEYRVAASELRKAIDRGMGVVITYSALASCYIKDGDMVAADRTFIEALEIFPRSVFLRVRYAIFLDDMSRIVDADQHFAIAYGVDSSQAKGWSNIIKNGSVAAYYAAKSDPAIASPVQLLPQAAVYEYLDENPAGAKIEVPN